MTRRSPLRRRRAGRCGISAAAPSPWSGPSPPARTSTRPSTARGAAAAGSGAPSSPRRRRVNPAPRARAATTSASPRGALPTAAYYRTRPPLLERREPWALPGDRSHERPGRDRLRARRRRDGGCAPPFAQCGGTAAARGDVLRGRGAVRAPGRVLGVLRRGAACGGEGGVRRRDGGGEFEYLLPRGLGCVVLDESYHGASRSVRLRRCSAEALERDRRGAGSRSAREGARGAAPECRGDCAGTERCDAGDDGACCAAAPRRPARA